MKNFIIFFSIILLTGCSHHKVDTVDEWCEQITGINLKNKYCPFWAILFSVSFDGDAIRDDYTKLIDKLHLEKVNHRAEKMAWREGTDLHLVNLSSLMIIQPEEVIKEWKKGIEADKTHKSTDTVDICLYGTLTSMFDNLVIHSEEYDDFGQIRKDNITIIPTEREKRLGKNRL